MFMLIVPENAKNDQCNQRDGDQERSAGVMIIVSQRGPGGQGDKHESLIVSLT